MTFDLETLMDGSADTKPSLHSPIDPQPHPPETSMALVRAQLTQLLMPEDAGEDMLTTQMAQMDVIFNHMLRDFANCPREATSLIQAKRLALALKLQQNCAHTARSIRAMRYMATLEQSIKRQSSAPTPPTPACESERTGSGENDS